MLIIGESSCQWMTIEKYPEIQYFNDFVSFMPSISVVETRGPERGIISNNIDWSDVRCDHRKWAHDLSLPFAPCRTFYSEWLLPARRRLSRCWCWPWLTFLEIWYRVPQQSARKEETETSSCKSSKRANNTYRFSSFLADRPLVFDVTLVAQDHLLDIFVGMLVSNQRWRVWSCW